MSFGKLYQPLKVGNVQLKHRIVLAPLTRLRADSQYVPLPHVKDYYSQRGVVPGTLLVTEATLIAEQAGGYENLPGIWSNAQIQAWKEVTDAVHANGSYIYCQLGAQGRTAHPESLFKRGYRYVSSSPIKIPGREEHPAPEELSTDEIKEYVDLYGQAAYNAVQLAGFDGVEIHGAYGHLVDQFTQDVSNHRSDSYGGSIEARTKFALEVIAAVSQNVGQKRTAIRFSPWSSHQGMKMHDPKPTFAHLATRVRELFPELAYVHVVEATGPDADRTVQSNDFLREAFKSGDGASDTRLISNSSYDKETSEAVAEEKGDLVSFGELFLANPDLPYRLKLGLPLNKGIPEKYYSAGSIDPSGYSDYPFANGEEAARKAFD